MFFSNYRSHSSSLPLCQVVKVGNNQHRGVDFQSLYPGIRGRLSSSRRLLNPHLHPYLDITLVTFLPCLSISLYPTFIFIIIHNRCLLDSRENVRTLYCPCVVNPCPYSSQGFKLKCMPNLRNNIRGSVLAASLT